MPRPILGGTSIETCSEMSCFASAQYSGNGLANRSATVDTRQVIDAYALWTFAPDLKLRVSASNLAARDSVSTTTVDGATTRQTATTWGRSSTAWAVRLEMKL